MAINISQIAQLLKPGVYSVGGKYEKIPKLWSSAFQRRKSTLAVEQKVQARYLGLPAIKAEGAATTMDNSGGTRFTFNAVTQEIGLGFTMTRRVLDDNQYPESFSQNAMGMIESFAQYKEIMAWSVFNNATTYDSSVGGDGVAMLSASHPYDGGTWANTPTTQVELSEASLINACLNIKANFVDEAGLKINAEADTLYIPIQLIAVAERLTKSELRPGTANNDVNAIRSMPGGVKEYVPVNWLTDTNNWFLTTSVNKNGRGLVMMEKTPFETDMFTDNLTQSLIVTGYERYVATYNDPRAVYGVTPT